jgi:hypothetical protein
MAWTTPRTWAANDVPTAALLNANIRDNMDLLKTSFTDAGQVRAFSSSYFASLDGANLTGIVKTAGATTFTAGKNNFSAGTARVVLPVGTDKFDGTAGNKTAGSSWVEGDYFHHIASNQNEWRFLGTSLGAPGGSPVVGSIWVDTDNIVHYIDASGIERKLSSTTSPHTDAAAVAGSVWVETYLHSASSGGVETQWHADTAHTDSATGAHTDTHSDSAPHSDSHSDTHSDSHSDVAHVDTHSDVSHGDEHTDHYDIVYISDHTDTAHDDAHNDTAHTDTHSDTHSDSHTDTVTHNDSHTDHADHADVTHADLPESMGT